MKNVLNYGWELLVKTVCSHFKDTKQQDAVRPCAALLVPSATPFSRAVLHSCTPVATHQKTERRRQ